MPFKSKAQQRLFFAKERAGELPKGTALEWAHHTPNIKALPEHVKKDAVDYGERLARLLERRGESELGVPNLKEANAAPAAATAANPAALSTAQLLLPALLGSVAGAGYGAYKAPGGSRVRGALIGGLGGAGAGAGLTSATEFLSSPYAKTIDNSGVRSALTLAGAGTGLHLGLLGGRRLSENMGLGDEKNQTANDLAEIDLMHKGRNMLPHSLREYFTSGKRAEDFGGFGTGTALGAGVGGAAGLGLGAALAAGAVPWIPAIYGYASAPEGRRLHGAKSTVEQTAGTLTGAGAGGLLGAVGGAGLAHALGASPDSLALGGALGAGAGGIAGGHLGNYISREMSPGPRQLGLGDRHPGEPLDGMKQAADTETAVSAMNTQSPRHLTTPAYLNREINPDVKATLDRICSKEAAEKGYKTQYPWTLKLTKGKSVIQRPTIGKPVSGMESLPGRSGGAKPKKDQPDEEAKKVTNLAPGKVASSDVLNMGQRLVFSPRTSDLRTSADSLYKSALNSIRELTPELDRQPTVSKAARDFVARLG